MIQTASQSILHWAMLTNRHFETTVRIQDHKVITAGPYRIVRHPGYTGVILWMISPPLMIGSTLAMIPALIASALLVLRTLLEDRTLHNELPGYLEYAEKVKHRLIPGLW